MSEYLAEQEVTHVAFADESRHNVGRYRGVCAVSMSRVDHQALSLELADVLRRASVRDFKWQKVKDARGRFAAKHLIDFTMEYVTSGVFRVDVLSWDCSDSRHSVLNRDDVANLGRMYYHLFRQVMHRRWPADSRWSLHPDENSLLNWPTLERYLSLSGESQTRSQGGQNRFSAKVLVQQRFGIEGIHPASSHDLPFVQMADFYVGMCVYSRSSYGRLAYLTETRGPQTSLFESAVDPEPPISKSDIERHDVITYFNERCKARCLTVSLQSTGGLVTKDPRNSLNFWWYEPQSADDIAPTKESF